MGEGVISPQQAFCVKVLLLQSCCATKRQMYSLTLNWKLPGKIAKKIKRLILWHVEIVERYIMIKDLKGKDNGRKNDVSPDNDTKN